MLKAHKMNLINWHFDYFAAIFNRTRLYGGNNNDNFEITT